MSNHPTVSPYPQDEPLSEFDATRLREDLAEALSDVLPKPEHGGSWEAHMRLCFRTADAAIKFFADRSAVAL